MAENPTFKQSQCGLCFQQSKDLKCLPCQHLFCEDCLRNTLQQSGFDKLGYFPCLICKLGVLVPLGGLQNFPTIYKKKLEPQLQITRNSKPKEENVNYGFKLTDPTSINCTENDIILVSDKSKSGVFLYDLEGKFLSGFSTKENFFSCLYTQFSSVFLSSLDSHTPLILEYTLTGKRILSKTMMNKIEPTHGICLLSDPPHIVVSSAETSSLYIVDYNGKLSNRFNGKGLLGHPLYLASTPKNEIVVSDHLNHCIKILTRDGKLKKTIGSSGTNAENLYEPRGVLVLKDEILIVDSGNRSVKSFKHSGKFITILFQSRLPEQPIDIALTSDKEHIAILLSGGVQARFIIKNLNDLKSAAPITCV